MIKRFFRGLKKRPVAFLSVLTLFILYFLMTFAEFLSPYTPTTSFVEYSNHPPSKIKWYSKSKGFGPQIQKRVVIDEVRFKYIRIKGQYQKINFFGKGVGYKLFGFIPMKRHFITVENDYPLFLFGSDNLGRDIFSRVLYGSRISLSIGIIGITISLFIAILLGGAAGYYGGSIDWLIMRIAELFILIPGIYLILFIRSVMSRNIDSGQSFIIITIILSFVGWPGTARMIRGMVHSIKREDFVTNAKLEGMSSILIIFKHIIPQMSSILIISVTLGIPGYILGETVLSYLGLGIVDPAVSWGSLINREITTISNLTNYPWFLIPGFFLLAVTFAFNFLGEYLRDLYDPYYNDGSF